MEKKSRCTGHCCTEFVVFHSNGEKYHQAWVKEWLADDISGKRRLFAGTRRLLQMLIPIADSEDNQYTTFTCQNFDTESRECRIYAKRPQMCRRFPVDGVCNFEGCTLNSAPVST